MIEFVVVIEKACEIEFNKPKRDQPTPHFIAILNATIK